MKWLDQFDFFFFDFDGLLVNTEQLHCRAYDQTFKSYGFSLDWDFATFCRYAHESTQAFSNAVYKALPKLKEIEPNWQEIRRKKTALYEDFLSTNQLQLMPGVELILIYLESRNIASCVVTNSERKQIDVIKEKLPLLDKIPCWMTREDYLLPKPNPDCYLSAIERFAYNSSHMIGFEDTIKGINALLGTPIQPVLINTLNHEGLKNFFHKRVKRFSSLIDVMNQE